MTLYRTSTPWSQPFYFGEQHTQQQPLEFSTEDAFFRTPVDQDSQTLFAFEWQDPESWVKT